MGDKLTRRGLVGAALAAGALSPLATEAGAHQAMERRNSFDDGWRFFLGDAAGAEAAVFDDKAWTDLHLPHDWSIAGPLDPKAPSGGAGGYAPTGIGWYRKAFTLPRPAAGQRVMIQFDGVYQRSEVWINGHSLGMRPNGYISFVHDLTPHLRPAGQANVIAVRVDNSLQPNSRWYSGSGIYRHAWLLITATVHVAPWGVHVRASGIAADTATVDVSTRIVNSGATPAVHTVRTTIVGPDGRTVATADARGEVKGGAEQVFDHRLKVPAPALWSLDAPELYSVQTTLLAGNKTIDTVTTPFGIRSAVFDVDKGFVLNGERVKLNGVCLHSDGGAVGAAVPLRVWERRLELLKEMGCNAIRCSHNPPAPEFLDLCDRLGFAVMAEAFDEWRHGKGQTPRYGYHSDFDAWWERDVTDMIVRDRNHPSIVIWSAGNEIPDQRAPEGPATLHALREVFHRLDPTRPVTVACDNIAAEPEGTPDAFLNEMDVAGYNYVDRWRDRREKYYAIDRQAHPDRRFIGTESSALGGIRGADLYSPDPTVYARASNRRIAVEQLQKFIQTWDYVSGDFLWTGIDYLGESNWPSHLASSGSLDTCGFKKDSFYFYQSLWSKQTVLHLMPQDWNPPGKDGQVVPVTCYTNCDTVELFLNGKSLGVKGYAFPREGVTKSWNNLPARARVLETTADLHLTWDVPYAPGVLKAVGSKDGAVVATMEVRTTGAPAGLRLSVDRTAIAADYDDVAHVTVEVVDSNGLVVPNAGNDIVFTVTGPGRVLAVDNGKPDDHDSYLAGRRHAFNGLALVLVQAQRPGAITLRAASDGLSGADIVVTAKP